MSKQRKRIVPNVVRGGTAIPIGDNLFYMQGRKHEQGGIDIGDNAKTGLEVEGGEVVQTSPKSIKVFSSVPFLYGGSPANLVMSGADPNKVFNAQEEFKDKNNINDDGTKKENGDDKNLNSLVDYILSRPVNFVQRLKNSNRKTIQDWEDTTKVVTHKLGAEYVDGIPVIYPNVQEIDGELIDFTMPPYDTWSGLDNAIEKGDTVQVKTLQDAINFTENYKDYIPSMKQYKNGGLSRNKDYGSSKKPYSSVKSEDFADGNRSYPIPTKADAIDALRLAGLHGRSDVKAKVYRKYPELRKRKPLGGDYLTDVIQDLEDSQKARTAERNRRANILLHTPIITINRRKQSDKDYSMPTFNNLLGIGENPYFNSNAYDNPFGIDIYRYIGQEMPSAETRNYRPTPVIEDVNTGNSSTGNVVQSVATPTAKISRPTSTKTSVPTIPLPLTDNIEVPEEEIVINDIPIRISDKSLYVEPITVPGKRNVIPAVLDSVGNLIDIGGNITSNILNRNMLNDLEYVDAPIPLLPTKLKTRININPQLERLYSDLAQMENAVNNNTTSSRTALARNQRLRNQVRQSSNELYGNKENIETQLINRDRLNQQEVAARNLRDYNQWRRGKTEFNNQIREALTENNVALTQGIGQSLNQLISNIQQRNAEARNLAYLSMSNPYAVEALTSNDFDNFYRMYGGFRCGGKKKVNRK